MDLTRRLSGLALSSLLAQAVTAACPVRWSASSNTAYIESAVSCTLSDIYTATSQYPVLQVIPPPNGATSKIWLLKANLQLSNGATLTIKGSSLGGDADEVRLLSNNSSVANSYVYIKADWGRLIFNKTKVTSWNQSANAPDTEYSTYKRAFISVRSNLAADGITPLESRMDITDSDMGYLGYYNAESYGLSWKVSSPISTFNTVDVLGDVTNSKLHNNYFGFYSYGGQNMNITGNEVYDNAKYGLDPHDDSDYLVISNNYVHDNGDHGIICAERCDNLTITGNNSVNNLGHGIMLYSNITDSLVSGNTATGNEEAGIALQESFNNTVQNNTLASNNYGILLQLGSANNIIQNNIIKSSINEGIYVYKSTDTIMTTGDDGRPKNNIFTGNTISSSGGDAIKLQDSDTNVFNNNTLSNELTIRTEYGVGNSFSANLLPSNITVKVTGLSSTALATAQLSTLGKVNLNLSNATATFTDSGGAIYDPDESALTNTVTNTGSSLFLNTAAIGSSSLVQRRTLNVLVPTGTTAIINPTSWSTSVTGTKQWTANVTPTTQTVTYKVSSLTANKSYKVTRSGTTIGTYTADNSGTVTFSSAAGTGTVTYVLSPS